MLCAGPRFTLRQPATAPRPAPHAVQPPGEASLPVAIFTVMANAPESLVATLCLIYVAGAATILIAAWAILLRRPPAFKKEG